MFFWNSVISPRNSVIYPRRSLFFHESFFKTRNCCNLILKFYNLFFRYFNVFSKFYNLSSRVFNLFLKFFEHSRHRAVFQLAASRLEFKTRDFEKKFLRSRILEAFPLEIEKFLENLNLLRRLNFLIFYI